METYLEIQQALGTIIDHVKPLESEIIPLSRLHNRFSAVDIAAREDSPPFDNSAMDGFAVHTDDVKDATRETPVVLTIVQNIYAGDMPTARLEKGLP